jgi:hypothetical protein
MKTGVHVPSFLIEGFGKINLLMRTYIFSVPDNFNDIKMFSVVHSNNGCACGIIISIHVYLLY